MLDSRSYIQTKNMHQRSFAGWLAGWLIGWLVGWLVGSFVLTYVRTLVTMLLRCLYGSFVCYFIGRLVACFDR